MTPFGRLVRFPVPYLVLLGVVQWVVGWVRPEPVHFWLTPIGLWAILGPLWILRRPRALPPKGPPHWTRRLFLWAGRQVRDSWMALAILSLLTFTPLAPLIPHFGLRNFIHTDSAVVVPAALAHWALNMGFVFLIFSYSLSRASTVIPLLALGVAGRALVESGAADGWGAWQELEIQWIVAKGIGLVWLATILDWRARRGFAGAGLHKVLSETLAIPRITHEALAGPLGRISRPRFWSWWLPPVLTLGMMAYLSFGHPLKVERDVLFGTVAVCLVSLVLFIREAARSLGGLRERGFLSELLLTLIGPGEIVAARSAQCLRPFRWCLGFHLLALFVANLFLVAFWNREPKLFYGHLGILGLTLFIGYLILGPYLNCSLRSRVGIEALFRTTLRLMGIEAIVLIVIWFLAVQGAWFRNSVLQLVLVPHTLLFLWVFDQWQRLLLDFEDLAHGRIEVKRRLASRKDVDAYQRAVDEEARQRQGI